MILYNATDLTSRKFSTQNTRTLTRSSVHNYNTFVLLSEHWMMPIAYVLHTYRSDCDKLPPTSHTTSRSEREQVLCGRNNIQAYQNVIPATSPTMRNHTFVVHSEAKCNIDRMNIYKYIA